MAPVLLGVDHVHVFVRDRAAALGAEWTPVLVERALWAHVGGKTGAVE